MVAGIGASGHPSGPERACLCFPGVGACADPPAAAWRAMPREVLRKDGYPDCGDRLALDVLAPAGECLLLEPVLEQEIGKQDHKASSREDGQAMLKAGDKTRHYDESRPRVDDERDADTGAPR